MHARRRLTLSLLPWLILVAAAGCGDEDGPADPGDLDPVSFDGDLRPIFEQNCSQCHIVGIDRGNLRLVGAEAYDQLVDVESSGYAPRVRVVPGEPDSSVLYLKVSGTTVGGQMPPTGALASESIATIRRWIEEGAEDN